VAHFLNQILNVCFHLGDNPFKRRANTSSHRMYSFLESEWGILCLNHFSCIYQLTLQDLRNRKSLQKVLLFNAANEQLQYFNTFVVLIINSFMMSMVVSILVLHHWKTHLCRYSLALTRLTCQLRGKSIFQQRSIFSLLFNPHPNIFRNLYIFTNKMIHNINENALLIVQLNFPLKYPLRPGAIMTIVKENNALLTKAPIF
jgi:hypothetical protein